MLREIKSLGFEWAELSHGIRISLLPGIMDAVDAGEMQISTLHNFCPLPMGVNHAAPNLYQFSSQDSRERDLAFRHTVKTIETAARLKASVVVLHLGSIDMKDYTSKLLDLALAGKKGTPKYSDLLATTMAKQEQKKERYMANTRKMIERLLAEAETRGISFGVENRQAVEEIPLDSDIDLLLREFGRRDLAYWHDCGHAQIKENLGFIDHRAHLESLSEHLIGFHVHDVMFPGKDHCAPGTGMIDFASLKPMVKPEHIKVFELSPQLPLEEVIKGVAHIRELWGES
jgi:sugar phosphate isomerase/epimerase